MRWDTCRYPGVDQNMTTIDALLASSEFQRGWERTGLSSGLKSCGVLCRAFLEVEVGEDSWQIKDRDPDLMMNEIMWQ